MNRPGFTLIETMLAVLLMALLAASASLSFSQPLKTSRTEDALDLVRSADAISRKEAITSGRNIRLVIDLSNNSLMQQDRTDLREIRRRLSLPSGCRIESVKIADERISAGQVIVDISPHGWSRSYSLHLQSPGADRWLVFAGLSGQMTQVQDESQIPTFHQPPRYDTH